MSERQQQLAEADRARKAEADRKDRLERDARISTRASIIAGKKAQKTELGIKAGERGEKIRTGDKPTIIAESLKTTGKLVFATNKKLRSTKVKQNKQIQTISDNIDQQNIESANIETNKDKYTKASYDTYQKNVRSFNKKSTLAIKSLEKNIDKIDSAISQNKDVAAEALESIKIITAPKKRLTVKSGEKVEKQKDKVPFVGPPTKRQAALRKTGPQKTNVAKLVKAGVAVVKGDQILLTVNPDSLTKNLAIAAQRAGFDITTKGGLSTGFYDWVDKNAKSDTVKRAGEYGAVLIGQSEKVNANTLGRISSWVSGKPQANYRKFDIDTLKQIKDLDPVDIGYLRVGANGANFLANYAAFVPIGVATSTVLKGISSIGPVREAGKLLSKTEIVRRVLAEPKLVQAMLYAPVVGIGVDKVFSDYQAGVPKDEILNYVLMTAGTLSGAAYGSVSGYKLSKKIEGWLATRGRSKIPPSELWSPEALKSQKYSTYKSSKKDVWSNEFKATARELTADGYLGEVAPGEYRVWHGTPKPIKDGDYFAKGVWSVGQGDSTKHAGVGLFVAPGPSSYGIRLHKSLQGKGATLGLPGVSSTGEIAAIDAFVEVMPSGLTQAQLKAWFIKQVGDSTVYIPPISTITREMEALLPPGTQLGVVGQEWYTNFGGQRVLVNKYVLIPAGAAVPAGVKTVSLASVSSSSLPTSEAYLAMGLVPPTYQSLSTSQINALSTQSGLSKSEISSLSKSIGSMSSKLTSADLKSTTVSTSDLKSVLKPSTIPTPTSTPLPSSTPPSTTPPSISPPTPTPTPTPEEPTPDIKQKPKQPSTKKREATLPTKSSRKIRLYEAVYQHKAGRTETIGPIPARSLFDAVQQAQRRRKSSKQIPRKGSIRLIGETRK